jgi:hypothetical protein
MSRALFDQLFTALLNLKQGEQLPKWAELRMPFENFLRNAIDTDEPTWRKAVEKLNALLTPE